jgi:hypothetical protein
MKTPITLTILLLLTMFNLFGQGKKDPNKNQFKFKDAENKACFTCNHVLNRERPILYVSHDSEGDWQFLCGQEDHTEEDAKIISLKQATELDQTINDLYEMPVGFGAERKTVKDKWVPFRLPAD